MPFAHVRTNALIDEIGCGALAEKVSKILAKALSKNEKYVAVHVEHVQHLLFGGSEEAAVYVEIKAVNLKEEHIEEASKLLNEVIQKDLWLSGNRIFIVCENVSQSHWAWNGKTFAALAQAQQQTAAKPAAGQAPAKPPAAAAGQSTAPKPQQQARRPVPSGQAAPARPVAQDQAKSPQPGAKQPAAAGQRPAQRPPQRPQTGQARPAAARPGQPAARPASPAKPAAGQRPPQKPPQKKPGT